MSWLNPAEWPQLPMLAPDGTGRILYQPGDIIVPKCDPFCLVLSPSLIDTHCSNCLKQVVPEHLMVNCCCCSIPKYCSLQCRASHWETRHGKECNAEGYTYAFMECPWRVEKVQLFALYAVICTDQNRTEQLVPMMPGVPDRCFHHLPVDLKVWEVDPKAQIITEAMAIYTKEDVVPPTLFFFRFCYGLIMTYSLPIIVNGHQVGVGLYIQTTLFKHSCRPSAYCCFKEGKLEVRAIGNIPSGVNPTISHVMSAYSDTCCRQKLVMNHMHVRCDCQKCTCEMKWCYPYDDLQALQSLLWNIVENPRSDVTWEDIRPIHLKIVEHLKKLYEPGDEPLTLHYIMMAKFTQWRFCGYVHKTLVTQAVKHINVTFGNDSEHYQEFALLLGLCKLHLIPVVPKGLWA